MCVVYPPPPFPLSMTIVIKITKNSIDLEILAKLGGYWMYAYKRCEFSTKTFYNQSIFFLLYLQVIINKNISAKPVIYYVCCFFLVKTNISLTRVQPSWNHVKSRRWEINIAKGGICKNGFIPIYKWTSWSIQCCW